jgi:hypothetical protein
MQSHISPEFMRAGSRPRRNHTRHHFAVPVREKLTLALAGPRALLEARYDKKQAVVLMLAALPCILALLVLTVPSVLFPTPEHREFYQFAWALTHEPVSFIPMLIGAVTLGLSFRVPLVRNSGCPFVKG